MWSINSGYPFLTSLGEPTPYIPLPPFEFSEPKPTTRWITAQTVNNGYPVFSAHVMLKYYELVSAKKTIQLSGTAKTTLISWQENEPAGTAASVFVSLDDNTFVECENGGEILVIPLGEDLTGRELTVDAWLTTDDPTQKAQLWDLQINIINEEEKTMSRKVRTAMSADTPKNILMDTGVVYVNFEVLGKLTLGTVDAGDTVTIGTQTYTAHATITTKASRQFSIAGTAGQDATELASCINDATNGTPGVSARAEGNVIKLYADTPGSVAVTGHANIVYDGTGKERTLGITDGGNQFTVDKELRDIPFDGARGKVKGMTRITNWAAKLATTIKEMTSENIKLSLTSATVNTSASTTHDIITPNVDITDSDYLENVAIVAPGKGKTQPYIIILDNALSTGGLDINMQDKAEGGVQLTLDAYFDPNAMDTVPFEIRVPKA